MLSLITRNVVGIFPETARRKLLGGVIIYRLANANVWFEHPTVFVKFWKMRYFHVFLFGIYILFTESQLKKVASSREHAKASRFLQAETWLTVYRLLQVWTQIGGKWGNPYFQMQFLMIDFFLCRGIFSDKVISEFRLCHRPIWQQRVASHLVCWLGIILIGSLAWFYFFDLLCCNVWCSLVSGC